MISPRQPFGQLLLPLTGLLTLAALGALLSLASSQWPPYSWQANGLLGFTALILIVLAGVLWRTLRACSKQSLAAASWSDLKTAIDLHALVSITDTRGQITHANEQFCTVSGYSMDELLGQNHRILRSGVHPPAFYQELWRTIASGRTWQGKICNRSKSGALYWVHSTIVPSLDDQGKPWRYISIRTDISDIQRAQSEAEANRQFLNALTACVTDGVYALDPEGNTLFVNRAAEQLLGWPEAELLGRNLHDLTHATRPDGTPLPFSECPVKKSIESNQVFRSDDEFFVTRSGAFIPISLTASPLISEGKTIGSVAVFRDLYNDQQLQNSLKQARDHALEASRLKSEFLSIMSHEIRTPMNGIIGMADLLADTPLDTQQSEYLQVIKDSSWSLLAILNDILDFSKIEAGKLAVESIEYSIQTVAESCLDLLAGKVRSKHILLTCHVDPALHLVYGDPGRVRQVLLNLLGNAIKFTETGCINLMISQQITPDSDRSILVEVTDTGIGIAQNIQSRLFQPFSQADGSVTRRYGGTGLGLSICARLVALMEGTIGLESTPGQGSRFWFQLPLRRSKPAPGLPQRSSPPRIVLCCALAQQQDLLQRLVTEYGGQVELTNSPDQTWQLCQQHRVEALLVAPTRWTEELLQEWLPFMAAHPQIRMVWVAVDELSLDLLEEQGLEQTLLQPLKPSMLVPRLFPSAPSAPTQRTTKPAVPLPGAASHTPSARANLKGLSILLVEDNLINQKVMVNLLDRWECHVTLAQNGRIALQHLASQSFDVTLMDCQMPEMDGFEATRQIRLQEGTSGQHASIIAMTANAMEGDRQACLEAGMDEYISKPVDPQRLEQLLQHFGRRDLSSAPPSSALPSSQQDEPAHMNPEEILDLKRLMDLFDGDQDLIKEQLALLVSISEEILEELQGALKQENYPLIKARGHELKGSAANMGARHLSSLGSQLEQAIKTNEPAGIPDLLTQLALALQDLRHLITRELGSS